MSKSTLCFSRIGNDGYKLARREDGVWFIKQGYYSQSFGWTTTKWQEVANAEDDIVIQEGLKAHSKGANDFIIGFGNQVVITDGKGLRLP